MGSSHTTHLYCASSYPNPATMSRLAHLLGPPLLLGCPLCARLLVVAAARVGLQRVFVCFGGG